MKVVCIKCNETSHSIGQHVDSYDGDLAMYVCLVCITKEEEEDA
jgi:hypothetical protein